jgi:hypothetical protein
VFVSRTGYHPRKQGDAGELSAISWFVEAGATVSLPFGHSPDYDLIADLDGRLLRVQVKTSTFRRCDRWTVMIATRGGNQSWTGLVKRFDPTRYDSLFVVVGDGRRWHIPAEAIEGTTSVTLGGPKYAEFEVERGGPLPGAMDDSSLDFGAARRDTEAVKRDAL